MNGISSASRDGVTALAWAFGLSLTLSACGSEADQRTETVTPDVVQGARDALSPDLLAQLDSGNLAMRAGDPVTALEHYRRATELDAQAAAAWFGVYMAERALGNSEAAEEALERARAAAPEASLLDAETVPEP
jgi:tetratricopeptide (TPR) repeat protein